VEAAGEGAATESNPGPQPINKKSTSEINRRIG